MAILNKLFFYLLIISNSVLVAQTNFEQGVKLGNGSDLNFQALSTKQEDAGDIIFSKYNNQEMARIRSEYDATNDGASIVFSTTPQIKTTFAFSSLGNLGIGTASPDNSLTIRTTPSQYSSHIYFGVPMATSGAPAASLCFGGSGIQNAGFTWVPNNLDNGKLLLSFGGYDNGFYNSTKMTFQSNGNIGIGTSDPKQKLTIVGDQNLIDQGAPANGKNSTAILRLQSSPNGAGEVLDFGMNIKSYGWIQPQDFNDPNAFYDLILNSKGGNVGVGIVNPKNKLDVKGAIHSQEVKVDMTGWSDFVFKKEYNLPTLEQVEKHIAEKGHLENIPNEEEVLKNGINVGEMNAKLLQKIEELTLYIIEMKKENQRQNEEIKKQSKEIEYIKNRK